MNDATHNPAPASRERLRSFAGWLNLIVIVSVALIAMIAIITLHKQAREYGRAERLLLSLDGTVHEMSSIEWQAIANRKLDAKATRKLKGVQTEMSAILGELALRGFDPPHLGKVSACYGTYREAVDAEFALLAAGGIEEAEALDEERVDPAFGALQEAISSATTVYSATAFRKMQTADAGSMLVVLFATGVIGSLYWRFIRVRLASQFAMDGQRVLREANAMLVAEAIERKRAKEALARVNRQNEMLLLSAGEGLFGLDPEGRTIFANRMAEILLGYSKEEMIGYPQHALIHHTRPDGAPYPREECPILGVFKDGQIHHIENDVFWRKDGTSFPVAYTSTPMRDEQGVVEGAVLVFSDITERKRAEDIIREERDFSLAVLDCLPGLFYLFDDQGKFLRLNRNFEKFSGCSVEEISRKTLLDFFGERDKRKIAEAIHRVFQSGEAWVEADFLSKDQTAHPVIFTGRLFQIDQKPCVMGMGLDITERKRAEEANANLENQLRQAQKMEAVGLLAGGVAHDFNNILTAIINYAEAARADLDTSPKVQRYLDEVLAASERAARLTHQLLVFGRKQVFQPCVLDLGRIVGEMGKMIQRLIGEDVHYTITVGKDLWRVKADPNQIEQLFLNLAVNARDAMPNGGRLDISIENITADEVYCQSHPGAEPGRYVALSITDTGTGIAPEVRGRIFEPFFTTKEMGKGTGLGLATVYGIVKQGGGFIQVYSEVGMGATFRVCIPAAFEEAAPVAPAQPSAAPGTELILVAEDEETVRKAVLMVLESLGYRVFATACVAEAKALFEVRGPEVDLLLTDMVMPDGTGRELYEAVSALKPGQKTLFMSGYTDDVLLQKGAAIPGTAFIQKPFTRSSLAQKLREVLDKS